MKQKQRAMRCVALSLGVAMTMGIVLTGTSCTNEVDALVIMTEDLNGLFNPFYSTTGTDMDVVGQTQISMLSTDKDGNIAYGEDEAVVVLDYKKEYDSANDVTSYYFVLKNGITFSDGVPLTMNDVLFNMYVYLDPAYTGSTTMYSTDIVGLQTYRTQTSTSDDSDADTTLTTSANSRAEDRRNELIMAFQAAGSSSSSSTSYDADEAKMNAYLDTYTPSSGYKSAIAVNGNISDEEARAQLKEDYQQTLTLFAEELETDYNSAKEAYIDEPYKSTGEFDEVTSFMYMEGYVEIEYNRASDGTYDKESIKKVTRNYSSSITTKEAAIEYVYNDKISSALHQILQYWATGTTMKTNFVAKAKEVILHETLGSEDGELIYKNISGIQSLGHTGDVSSIEIDGTTYKVATAHNEDGTVANSGEYDVLRIQINGVDPKAIWNFAFTVAPYHYYSDPDLYPVDIENNEFGVEWASYDFMTNVIQGTNDYGVSKNKVPLGAGPYVATDRDNNDNPEANDFYSNDIVYYKANSNFLLGSPKIEKMHYQVVSSSNAIGNLTSGQVHFVSPQLTKANADTLEDLKDDGYESVSTWQLGYGYIGINAAKVTNRYLRYAIMSAMQASLALQYYSANTAVTIAWPMSAVSWAYPRTTGSTYDGANPTANMETNNNHSYTQWTGEDAAITKIKNYMSLAGVEAGDSSLSIKFTISGSSMTEHPAYNTMKQAMDLLNECGWDVEISADINALTKLATGSLTVWAAAWGSTIDPDMYQVYHKNSTATSVLAWGYDAILSNTTLYSYENSILNTLSAVIEEARETEDQTTRAALYKEAMGYVLDLGVEFPLYQRQTLYAYNANVIDSSTLPEEINSYTSPLSRIWEIEFVK